MCCGCRFVPHLLIIMLCKVIHYSLCENFTFISVNSSRAVLAWTPRHQQGVHFPWCWSQSVCCWSGRGCLHPSVPSGPQDAISRTVRKYLPSIVLSTFRNSCSSMNGLPSCNQCQWFYFASEEILSSRSLLQLCRACWHMQSINSP